jgi:hypothetical protein
MAILSWVPFGYSLLKFLEVVIGDEKMNPQAGKSLGDTNMSAAECVSESNNPVCISPHR